MCGGFKVFNIFLVFFKGKVNTTTMIILDDMGVNDTNINTMQ